MSNLLKSKFFLGVMIFTVIFAGFAIANTASASCDLGSTTLKYGSRGAAVECLQTTLEVTPVTGFFGNITKAAVKAFQASASLKADGIAGPMTKAALSVAPTTPETTTTTTTTEALCPNNMTVASNCTTAPAATTTTEALCPNNMTVASNCTTGLNTVSTSGEGSLTVTMESSPSNGTEIAYSTTKGVMALKVKATGASMTVNRVDFNFSKRAWLYANNASLYDGSTVIASRDLASNSFDEIIAGTNYRLRFDGLNVAVAKDTSKVLTLKLTSPSIISDPNTLVTITVATDSVRASDATGLVSYEGVADTRTFKIKTATAGSLVASLDTTSPKVGTVAIDDVDNTTDVPLLVTGLKATGSDVNVTEIPVALTVVTGGTADGVDDAVEAVRLYKDGTSISTATFDAGCSTSLVCTVTFSDLDETIAKDVTAKYTIKADLKPIDGTVITANTTVQATMTVGSALIAEDTNYDTVVPTGTSIGAAQHLFVVAPQVSLVSASKAVNPGDPNPLTPVQPVLTGTIIFKVKALGGTIYLNRVDTTTGTTRALLNGNGGIDQGSVSTDTLTATTYTVSGADAVTDGTNYYYTITDGQEVTVTATGYITSLTPSGLQQVRIEGLQWGTVVTNETTRAAQTPITWGFDDFHTIDELLAFY